MKTSCVLACCIVLASLLAVSCGQESVAPDSPATSNLDISAAQSVWERSCESQEYPVEIPCLGETVTFSGEVCTAHHVVESAGGTYNVYYRFFPGDPRPTLTGSKVWEFRSQPVVFSLHDLRGGENGTIVQRDRFVADDGSTIIATRGGHWTMDPNGIWRVDTYEDFAFECR